jgi:rsbT co-antagonist protein RsbR
VDQPTTRRLANLLTEHRADIIARWIEHAREGLRGRLTKSELAKQIDEFYSALTAALDNGVGGADAPGAADLLSVLGEWSRNQARHGLTATETAISVFGIKPALLASIPDNDAQALVDFADFSQFVDRLGLYTFEQYVNARDAVISEQTEQLLELSTPVIKLWDGVVAVPLIGTLDSARSQVVMERLLQALLDTGSPFAILDITGVPAVDTQVAQHILKTVVAAQLMGAQCIISGIRPQIAQTIVSLGIEFGEIVTKANLADALQHALRNLGVDIKGHVAKPVI